MSKRILIIEDERSIVDILKFNLSADGFEVLEAYDGKEGLDLALSGNLDLILLDVMLPSLDGFEVCRRIRKEDSMTPIIMLTAREEEADKVFGLELGADDYITKPFSMRELLARVTANMRRTAVLNGTHHDRDEGDKLTAGGLVIDKAAYKVTKDKADIELTQREFELLSFLASHPGRVFSREEMMEKVWNYDYYGDLRTVDVTVRRLREKVEDNPADPVYIITRRGVGYMFAEL